MSNPCQVKEINFMPILTLTTDFGTKDGFVGTMKGVIWSICPTVQIADISHEISPQNVIEGAYALGRAYAFFPSGTIHVAVVDPGVGTARRPIAAMVGQQVFVGPDNGLFTLIFNDADMKGWLVKIVHLANPEILPAPGQRHFSRAGYLCPGGSTPGCGSRA